MYVRTNSVRVAMFAPYSAKDFLLGGKDDLLIHRCGGPPSPLEKAREKELQHTDKSQFVTHFPFSTFNFQFSSPRKGAGGGVEMFIFLWYNEGRKVARICIRN